MPDRALMGMMELRGVTVGSEELPAIAWMEGGRLFLALERGTPVGRICGLDDSEGKREKTCT